MTLDGLAVLCSVADERSINGAARALDIAPSTAWRRLQQLERDLQCRLVERTPTQVRLTQAGREALRHGRDLLQSARMLEEAVHTADKGEHAELRVGLLPVAGFEPMMFAWDRLVELRPGLSVVLIESPAALHPLRDDLDLVVTHAVPDDPGLFVQRIFTMPVRLYASSGYAEAHGLPASVDEVEEHALAVHCLAGERADVLRLRSGGQHPVRPRLTTTSPMAVLAWIESGRGLGLLPAPQDVPGLCEVLPDLAGFDRTIYLVAGLRRRDSDRLQLVEEILSHLAEAIPGWQRAGRSIGYGPGAPESP